MINEIKKLLARGEAVELECVDREGFLKDTNRCEANDKILEQGSLLVDYIDCDGDIRLVGEIGDLYFNVIVSEEFKYFRIKEESPYIEDNPTFNDLIDIAMRAWKDGYLKVLEFERGDGEQIFTVIGEDALRWHDGDSDYSYAVDLINSLYTETFVIESEEEMKKMRIGSKGVLPNGLEFKVTDTAIKMFDGDNDLGITVNFKGMDHNELLYLSPLKGATITQKKGY